MQSCEYSVAFDFKTAGLQQPLYYKLKPLCLKISGICKLEKV